MRNAQLYCTLAELISDLNLTGDQAGLFSRIQAASRFIERRFGNFIPVTGTRRYQGNGISLRLDQPILSINGIQNNGSEVVNYTLHPTNRHWDNGPYTRLEIGSGYWDEVEITGEWGRYREIVSLGENVTQTINATTLAVGNGSLLSPGMVLLIDDEQQLVIDYDAPTATAVKLAADIDPAQEEITVTDGTGIHEKEVIHLSTELLLVRMVRGNTLVTVRGWNGTTKQAHSKDDVISVYRTFRVERGVNGTTAAVHDADLQMVVPPGDVNWLCRQIAGLMHKKAQSGFAGRVGNAELGETFYFNEFPSQVKEIKQNYRIVSL